jgi:hypothetical protein
MTFEMTQVDRRVCHSQRTSFRMHLLRLPRSVIARCPRGRTFVSSGVHPVRYRVANRLDYESLSLLQFGLLIAWSTCTKRLS